MEFSDRGVGAGLLTFESLSTIQMYNILERPKDCDWSPHLSEYHVPYTGFEDFLAALSSSRSLVVGPSVRRSVGQRTL